MIDPTDGIVSQIVDRITDALTTALQTSIASSDPTYVATVKAGRFQDDPVTVGNYITIMNGDLDDVNYLDGNVDKRRQINEIGFDVESREIGGTEMWWRRGTLRIGCFFITKGYDERKARKVATAILSRAEITMVNCRVSDLRDPYGEHAIKLFCPANSFFQSGGPPANYIWRGKVLWQVLTERSWI